MRDYTRIDKYLDKLAQDIHPQPSDPGHIAWTTDVIVKMCPSDVSSVLDVGCGEGFSKAIFKKHRPGINNWVGVTLGADDYKKAKDIGNAYPDDVTFLKFDDNQYDLIFARHILEHSPMPLLTLMEWYRVGKKYLLLVFPAWEYWLSYGKNHYYMFTKDQLWWLLARSGWKVIKQEDFTTSDKLFMDFYMVDNEPNQRIWNGSPKPVEYRYLCIKGEPQTE